MANGNLLTKSTPLLGTAQAAVTSYAYGDTTTGNLVGHRPERPPHLLHLRRARQT